MIGTIKKPMEEVLEALGSYRKIAVLGCDGYAKACSTGGAAQVAEMSEELRQHRKEVVFDVTPERTCYLKKSQDTLAPHREDQNRTGKCYIASFQHKIEEDEIVCNYCIKSSAIFADR
jgi:GTP-sensing pleiotropic transcriptional regulator CodY